MVVNFEESTDRLKPFAAFLAEALDLVSQEMLRLNDVGCWNLTEPRRRPFRNSEEVEDDTAGE
jgi:hypothetical protein